MVQNRQKVNFLTILIDFGTFLRFVKTAEKSFFRPLEAFLSWFELHWTYISRENTWSIIARANNQILVFARANNQIPLKKLLYTLRRVFSFIGRIFLKKIDFEKSPKNGQISPKSKGLTLTFWRFWTIFEIF